MRPTIKLPSSRFRNSRRAGAGNEKGYVLVVVMFMAALILIALTATLPNVYTQGRREKESELVFRGMQYARAVALFHRQFNRFPTDVKELLQTNGMRFLRQEYKDPMTHNGKWRFVHANAAGVLLDSKLRPMLQAGQPGAQGTGTLGSGSPQGSMFGGSSAGSSFGGSSAGSSFGGSSPSGPSGLSGGSPQGLSIPSSDSSSQAGGQSSSFFSQGEIRGAYIVGVASTSKKSSLRVWNKRSRYDEWEFLGVDPNILGMAMGVPGVGQGAGTPGAPGQGLGGMQPGTPMGPGMPGQPMSPGGFGGPQPPTSQPMSGPGGSGPQ